MLPGRHKEINIYPVGVRGDVLSRLDMFAALDRLRMLVMLREPRMVTHLLLARASSCEIASFMNLGFIDVIIMNLLWGHNPRLVAIELSGC